MRGLCQALAIKTGEIDRIDIKRRKTAVADGLGDDLAGEREEQPRAFDHHHRLNVALRDVQYPEDAGIVQLELEQSVCVLAGGAFEQQFDLVIGLGDLPGIDVDLDRNVRRLLLRPSERGAFGFSKEKSFIYCTKALSAGPFASAPPPLLSTISLYSAPQAHAPRKSRKRVAWMGAGNKRGSGDLFDPVPILRRQIDGVLGLRLRRQFLVPPGRQEQRQTNAIRQKTRTTSSAAPIAAKAPLRSVNDERRKVWLG